MSLDKGLVGAWSEHYDPATDTYTTSGGQQTSAMQLVQNTAAQNAMMNAAQDRFGSWAAGAQGVFNQDTSDSNHQKALQKAQFELALQQAKLQTQQAKVVKRSPDFVIREDLHHPVFRLSTNTLRDVWMAKFGLKWVEQEHIDTTDDPRFWALARTRMQGLQMLEAIALNNGSSKAYRIKQDPDASY